MSDNQVYHLNPSSSELTFLQSPRSSSKEIFYQFDNEEPVKLGECMGYFQIRLNGEDHKSIEFRSPNGEKIFKIFINKK